MQITISTQTRDGREAVIIAHSAEEAREGAEALAAFEEARWPGQWTGKADST